MNGPWKCESSHLFRPVRGVMGLIVAIHGSLTSIAACGRGGCPSLHHIGGSSSRSPPPSLYRQPPFFALSSRPRPQPTAAHSSVRATHPYSLLLLSLPLQSAPPPLCPPRCLNTAARVLHAVAVA